MKAMTFSVPRALRSLGRDRRGTSAIEFAILAPLMIGLYIGCVEISDGVAADRKVTLTAGTLANLTAQTQTISTTVMNNILTASTSVMSPYTGFLTAKVSCIKIDAGGAAKVAWGAATANSTPRAPGSSVTIPADLSVPNSSLVFSEVSYKYEPVTGYTGFNHITGPITLSDVMYMSPRITPPVLNGTACS
jgi:Flp pilus assembly protein TadG